MKKFIALVLCLALVLTNATLILAACHDNDLDSDHVDPNDHDHSYETTWSKSKTHHWHAANCGHTLVEDYAPHDFDATGKCSVCLYQNETDEQHKVDRDSWESIFSQLAEGIYNFTKTTITTNKGDTTIVQIQVDEDAIHRQVGDGSESDTYILFDGDDAIFYTEYNGNWIPYTHLYYDIAAYVTGFLNDPFYAFDYMGASYWKFTFNEESGSYVWEEEVENATIVYEVVFAGGELFSLSAAMQASEEDYTSVEIYDNIGTTQFEITPKHQHEYDSEWSSSNRYHWHSSTCHDNVVDIKLLHDFDASGKCNVCHYVYKESDDKVSNTVWAKAFDFHGVSNWTRKETDFSGTTTIKYTGSIYSSEGSDLALEMDGDGTIWKYRFNDGVWYKTVSDSLDDVVTMLSASFGMLSPFEQFETLYHKFDYVDGVYVASDLELQQYGTSDVQIVLDGDELASVTITRQQQLTSTVQLYDLGTTTVELPDAVEHEHNFQVRDEWTDANSHSVTCWECNTTLMYQPHEFVGGKCTVCGISDHEHVFNRFVAANDAFHFGYCDCGMQDPIPEVHIDKDENGVCDKCGFEQGANAQINLVRNTRRSHVVSLFTKQN